MSNSGFKSGSLSAQFRDTADAELTSEDLCIEADGEYDTEPLEFNVDDEDLNADYEAEHCSMFTVIDEVREEDTSEESKSSSKGKDVEKKRFVIPKLKKASEESGHIIGEEGKRDWHKSEQEIKTRERDGGRRDHRGARNGGRERDNRKRERDDKQDSRENRGEERGDGQMIECKFETLADNSPKTGQAAKSSGDKLNPSVKAGADQRPTLFESFAKQGLMVKESSGGLAIPMGKDSLVSIRDYHVWQVRLYPVFKTDVTCPEFIQVWTMADSSSIVWSGDMTSGGVAEFLLKDESSIQKFMRKILWYSFTSEELTVEVTERERRCLNISTHDDSDKLDAIINKITFKYNNKKARQLIKTYYPTPEGEVTERSVFINNLNSGKALNLLKAVFPCAAKINVTRSTKFNSSAIVETAGAGEAHNYLVVYLEMTVNNVAVHLGTSKKSWEDVKAGKTSGTSSTGPRASQSATSLSSVQRPTVSTSSSGSNISTSVNNNNNNRARMAAVAGAGAGRGNNRQAKQNIAMTSLEGKRGGKAPGNKAPARGDDSSARGQRGGVTRRGVSRGGGYSRRVRGGGKSGGVGGPPPSRNAGRVLLPDPPLGGGGMAHEGLLPHPSQPAPPPEMMRKGGPPSDGLLPLPPPSLLGLPVKPTPKGILEGDMLGPLEETYLPEMTDIRHELEERVLETRAQLESHLSKMDEVYRVRVPAAQPRRSAEYPENDGRPIDHRQALLPPVEGRRRPPSVEGRRGPPRASEREEWLNEPDYHRPPASTLVSPPPTSASHDRGYDVGPSYSSAAYSRSRANDYVDDRSSHARPYLLEAPPEPAASKGRDRDDKQVFDYDHAHRHALLEPEVRRDDHRSLLGRPPLIERERDRSPLRRVEYVEERRSYSSRDSRYDYEDLELRQPPPPSAYSAYEEDSRRLAVLRYKDNYDRRY